MQATVKLYNPSGRQIEVDASREAELLKKGYRKDKTGAIYDKKDIPVGNVYKIKNASGYETKCEPKLIAAAIAKGAVILEVDGEPFDVAGPAPAPKPKPPAKKGKTTKPDAPEPPAPDAGVIDAVSAHVEQVTTEQVAKSLEGKTKDELLKMAKDAGLSVTSKMNMDVLVTMLSEAGVTPDSE